MSNNAAIFIEELNRYYEVWQEYNYVYGEWAKAHGLSVNSLMVLYAISGTDQTCTQKKISQRWMIPKQTVNMILKEFEKNGLVQLLPLKEDKRNKQIRLTAEGQKYSDEIISRLRQAELFVAEKMGMERMKQLNEYTTLFVELFSQAVSEAK